MFCSVTLNCHFLKFSPPARVSKTSLDCIVCFLVNDKAKRFFFFFFYQGCTKNQVFFSSKYVTKNKLVIVHLWFLPLMNDPEIIRVCFPSCVHGPADLKTPESPQCSFTPKPAHIYLQPLPSMLHWLLQPSHLPLIMTANPFFHPIIYVLFIHKTV